MASEEPKQCEREARDNRRLAGVKRISQYKNGGNRERDGLKVRDS